MRNLKNNSTAPWNNPCYQDNVAYYGHNLVHGNNNKKKSREACHHSCKVYPGCKFWSFQKPTHIGSLSPCFLKHKKNYNYNKNYVSGPKYCSSPPPPPPPPPPSRYLLSYLSIFVKNGLKISTFLTKKNIIFSTKYISETSDFLCFSCTNWKAGPDIPDISGGWPGIGVGQFLK